MIVVYNSVEIARKISNRRVVENIDWEFKDNVSNKSIDKKDKEFMWEIDRAEYLRDGAIVTPFGGTGIENLSTGCKALIIINHVIKQIKYKEISSN